jgi:hypothetical protein
MSGRTIHVTLSVHEARALTAAADLVISAFGPDVRSELSIGSGESNLELAALRVASAIESEEVFV